MHNINSKKWSQFLEQFSIKCSNFLCLNFTSVEASAFSLSLSLSLSLSHWRIWEKNPAFSGSLLFDVNHLSHSEHPSPGSLTVLIIIIKERAETMHFQRNHATLCSIRVIRAIVFSFIYWRESRCLPRLARDYSSCSDNANNEEDRENDNRNNWQLAPFSPPMSQVSWAVLSSYTGPSLPYLGFLTFP